MKGSVQLLLSSEEGRFLPKKASVPAGRKLPWGARNRGRFVMLVHMSW